MLRRTRPLRGPRSPGRRRARQLLPAGILAVLVAASVSWPTTREGAAALAPGEVRVATWNMCGVRQWNCQDTGDGSRKVRALERLAGVDGVRVFLLQEVCAGDLAAARSRLGSNWHSTFTAYVHRDAHNRGTTVRCAAHGQGTAGIAILASSPLSRVTEVPAQQPSAGLRRGIICATAAVHRLRVCNAHLSLPGSDPAHPGWEFRDDQLESLMGAADGRTVFGGDLNSAPPSARNRSGWIWPRGFFRRFQECDQASPSSRGGRATLASGHKVDYLFTALPRTGCSVHDTGASDHYALVLRTKTG
ncbi:endonuclease/exonuclease/phosphatase family protein [Streptomyces sp. NBC_01336]|uniref:endonuclease/exonuclease/phosphatase family protein n=1 Tax=Streptomyces sp. NBC_01336 TaxID=2903829 RepID=UPI002E120848|nr:endonuclease/exonuclease/phosphatase family protein [Streptomyces sp. NBC_01336]